MKKHPLTASETLLVDDLFVRKGWPIDDDKEIKISLYKRFLDRLRRIPPETKDILIEITERFERIELKEIYSLFYEAFHTIPKERLEQAGKIYIMPLVQPEVISKFDYEGKNWKQKIETFFRSIFTKNVVDRPKNKSGEKVLSIVEIDYGDLFCNDKIVFPEKYGRFKSLFRRESDLLLLVDDFIGSGDTANEVLKHYFRFNNFNNKNTVVLSLVAQKEGIKNITKKYKVEVFQALVRERAIQDYYGTREEIDSCIKKVKAMENAINCNKQLSLGYKNSQALVSIMNKCPNNTLPVFWHETASLPAPFPRKKIFRGKNG